MDGYPKTYEQAKELFAGIAWIRRYILSCTICLQYLLFVKSAAKSASQELMPCFQGACINLKSFISNHPPSWKFFFFWLFARLRKFWFLDFLVSENNFLHCNSHSKFHYIAECTRTAINVIWQTHNKPLQNSIIIREISFTFGFLFQSIFSAITVFLCKLVFFAGQSNFQLSDCFGFSSYAPWLV